MNLTQTQTGWQTRQENNKEEVALAHFSKVHEHLAFSNDSTESSAGAIRRESRVPQFCPGQPDR